MWLCKPRIFICHTLLWNTYCIFRKSNRTQLQGSCISGKQTTTTQRNTGTKFLRITLTLHGVIVLAGIRQSLRFRFLCSASVLQSNPVAIVYQTSRKLNGLTLSVLGDEKNKGREKTKQWKSKARNVVDLNSLACTQLQRAWNRLPERETIS